MDLRRAGTGLLVVLAGAAVAAWLTGTRAAAVVAGVCAVLVAGAVVRGYRGRPRVELEDQPARRPTEDTNSNVHVVRPEPEELHTQA